MKASIVAVIGGAILASALLHGPVQAQDFYAIAGSFPTRNAAAARAEQLGSGWRAMRTNQCPNFTRNLWVAAAGPSDKDEAEDLARDARRANIRDAYVKSCY